jgi:hypothetical protein
MIHKAKLNELIGRVLGDLANAMSIALVRIGDSFGQIARPRVARRRLIEPRRAHMEKAKGAAVKEDKKRATVH